MTSVANWPHPGPLSAAPGRRSRAACTITPLTFFAAPGEALPPPISICDDRKKIENLVGIFDYTAGVFAWAVC